MKGKIYYIGSVKQADNFNIVTEIILQHIQRSQDQGALAAQALRKGEDVDFNSMMPASIKLPKNATQEQKNIAAKILDQKV